MSFKKTGSHYDKNLKEWLEQFEAEYESDVSALPEANPGSTCLVKETGKTVVMANNGVWGGGSAELPFGETTTVREVLADFTINEDADVSAIPALGLVEGATCTVVWNGVEYTCPVVAMEEDGVVFNTLTTPLFMLVEYPSDIAASLGANVALNLTEPGTPPFTLSIRQEVTEVKQISGKYVEGMGYTEKSVSGKVVVEETAYRINDPYTGVLVEPEPLDNGNYASMTTEFSFESGKTYRITVDGVPYVGIADYRDGYGNFGDGSGVPLVDENGGYHGVFVTATGTGYATYFYYDEGPEVGHTGTFIIEEVTEVETIHPIDEKLIVLTSPNGTKYSLSVADDGTLSAVAVT